MIINEDGSIIVEESDKLLQLKRPRYTYCSCDTFVEQYGMFDIVKCNNGLRNPYYEYHADEKMSATGMASIEDMRKYIDDIIRHQNSIINTVRYRDSDRPT